jgi:TPR repeat protein
MQAITPSSGGQPKMSFKAIAIIVLASSFAVTAVAGPLEDAGAAERRDDCTTAVSIYRSLAEKGVGEAYSRLGYFSEIGYCAKRDWLHAAKWYGKAIEAGDQASAANLSHIGRNWRFINLNAPMDPIIYELIEQAAKKGSAVAQFSLGVMNYPIGDQSFDPSKGNLSEALIWYRRAAEQGDVDAMVAMGMAYADGIGVPQDYVEAHKWYNVAAPRTNYGDIRNDIMKRREDLSLKMTTAQISEAQKLARDWKPNK